MRLSPQAADKAVKTLSAAAGRLLEYPRIGEKLDHYEPREVRRLLIGHCEMRYEIQDATIYVLRIRHTREKRP
jgi:plasmid stabilization system protein ParE